jgi:hypothetical protein
LAPGAWTTSIKEDGPVSASAGVAEWKGGGPKIPGRPDGVSAPKGTGGSIPPSGNRSRPCGGRENAAGLEPAPSGDVPVRLGAGPIAMRRWSSGGTPVLQTGGRSFDSSPAQNFFPRSSTRRASQARFARRLGGTAGGRGRRGEDDRRSSGMPPRLSCPTYEARCPVGRAHRRAPVV